MRCFGDGVELYERYHDEEWGVPVRDEQGLFERMTLEAFQSGLAWITILRKRDGFRAAFAGFDPEAVAAFGDADRERLLADAGIVRNRAKVDAAIANAKATVALREHGGLPAMITAHRPPQADPPPRTLQEMRTQTDETKALSKALKAHGFRFVGPTTLYALMQACGYVDDHVVGCPRRGAHDVAV